MNKKSMKKPMKTPAVNKVDATEILTVYNEGEVCVRYKVNPKSADSVKAALVDSGYLCDCDDPDEIAEEIVKDGCWWDEEISFCVGDEPPHVK